MPRSTRYTLAKRLKALANWTLAKCLVGDTTVNPLAILRYTMQRYRTTALYELCINFNLSTFPLFPLFNC